MMITKHIKTLLILSVAALTGCNDYLDLVPKNDITLISAALYFNVFYKYLSNKKLLRILPCQKFHLS